ncbi:MAG: PD-(D/E)XK nuclease family protein [Planctomycetota bacterium]|nr:PD-(D/E)XK nuclease family protein [Planctomycetota bacterium]
MKTCAKWLLEHKLHSGSATTPPLKVIVQSRSAARQLRSNLLYLAGKSGHGIALPVIETPYQFTLSCLPSDESVADELVVKLLIGDELQRLSEGDVTKLFGKQLTKDWRSYAEQIYKSLRLCTLAGVQLNPTSWTSDASGLPTPEATERLEVLETLIGCVSKALQEEGFSIEHHAIQSAVLDPQNCVVDDLILVGITDLQPLFVQAMDNYRDAGKCIDVLIRAPEECRDGFNHLGVVDVEYWNSRTVNIPDDCIHVAGAPSHQSSVLLHAINSEKDIPVDELLISVTDEPNSAVVKQYIEDYGIQTRVASGQDVTQTLPFLLLQLCMDWISTRSANAFASLIRHPDMIDLLHIQEQDIASFDDWRMQYLPEFLIADALRVIKREEKKFGKALMLFESVHGLFNKHHLYQSSDSTSQHLQCIREFLLELYGEVNLRSESPMLGVFRSIFGTLELIEEADAMLGGNTLELTKEEVLRSVIERLRTTTLPEYPNENAVEIVGWLEAMNADDPYLFVVGMDAESIHKEQATPFFPNQVKHALGVDSVELRLARDAHALEAMAASRSTNGALHLIVARKGLDGESLTPSSLLLKCSDSTQLATRALALTTSLEREMPTLPKTMMRNQEGAGMPLPNPSDFPIEQPSKVSVTAFKDYLSCPYRYWLKHILRLRVAEDALPELDHKDFGILFHLILQEFSEDDKRRAWLDPKQIEQYLLERLDQQLLMRFGSPKIRSGLIQLQREVAIARIALFARQHAQTVREGWRILASEVSASFDVLIDEKQISVHGKIDRIEQNESGVIRVLDYKTGSAKPNQTHIKNHSWVDLQLPLYRRLLNEIPVLNEALQTSPVIQLGYFNIASNESKSGIHLLDITDELEQSIEPTIHTCLKGIVHCEFGEKPATPAPKYSEDLSWICQDSNAFGEGEHDGSE